MSRGGGAAFKREMKKQEEAEAESINTCYSLHQLQKDALPKSLDSSRKEVNKKKNKIK